MKRASGRGDCRLLHDFKLTRLLGAGAYGAAILSVNRIERKSYAVKVLGGRSGNEFSREVQNLVQIPPHKNVVQYFTCWEDRFSAMDLIEIKQLLGLSLNDNRFMLPFGQQLLKGYCIQMELCGDDLRRWLGRHIYVDRKQTTAIFLQIARGLEHIHKHNIIHRDLKPDNIFLGLDNNPNSVKIGDLGIATQHQSARSATHTERMGSRLYLAPEQESVLYGKPVDLYALGLIFFELLRPEIQPAYHNGSYQVLTQYLTNLRYKQPLSTTFQTRYPKESNLIVKLLRVNPSERPGFKKIFESLETPVPVPVPAIPKPKVVRNAIPAPAPVPAIPKPTVVQNAIPAPAPAVAQLPRAVIKITIQQNGRIRQPEHSICIYCKKSSSNYIVKDYLRYCEDDYHNLFSPRCARCKDPIREPCRSGLGRTWHPECFVCWDCHIPLTSYSYYRLEGKIYCETDFKRRCLPPARCQAYYYI